MKTSNQKRIRQGVTLYRLHVFLNAKSPNRRCTMDTFMVTGRDVQGGCVYGCLVLDWGKFQLHDARKVSTYHSSSLVAHVSDTQLSRSNHHNDHMLFFSKKKAVRYMNMVNSGCMVSSRKNFSYGNVF